MNNNDSIINTIDVEIKLLRKVDVPQYATPGSAALDLRSAVDDFIIMPGEMAIVPTGLAIAPKHSGVVGIIAARSGLASKHGITLPNGIGVIDSDYRGELCVALINHGKDPFTVVKGDRIAQLMFVPVYTANLIEVDELSQTLRGSGGFGSTGVK